MSENLATEKPDTLISAVIAMATFANKVAQREQPLNPAEAAHLASLINRLRALEGKAA